MADIRNFVLVRHLRAESNAHVLHRRSGRLQRTGRALSFWFLPHTASIAEIPLDDREVPLSIRTRSSDFQDITVQGVITYRVVDPASLAEHVDFSIDPRSGLHLRQPLERIAIMLTQLAQEHACDWIARTNFRDALRDGPLAVREAVRGAFDSDPAVSQMGLALASVRIASLAPAPELERALEAPMREKIQQDSDEAAFARRALAVEKERAIQENELQNQIELARREEQLIERRGTNERRRASEAAEAAAIATIAEADRLRTSSEAQARALRALEGAKVDFERARMQINESVSPVVLAALAARDLAAKLQRIDHLHLGTDALGPLLAQLAAAGTHALEQRERSGE